MVFSSIPAYLDPPNWQQQQHQQQTNHQQHQHGSSSDDHNPQLQPPALPPPPGGGANSSSVRPASMADRARLAKVPQPEVALKCPRCESTNTKFCYFNNYSLTQPRHFCKTCRRYWTRGGALRNVPVGGGCRRNKRSKGSSSKSPATSEQQRQSGPGSTNSIPSNSCTNDIMCHMTHQPPTQLPFMASLHHLTDYGGGDIGLNFGGIQPQVLAPSGGGGSGRSDMDFHMGNSSGGGGGGGGGDHGGNILSSGGSEQWRMQQFPFLAGLHPQQGLYPFEGEGVEQGYGGGLGHQLHARAPCSMAMHGQMSAPSVKTEDNHGLNLSRQFLGIPGNDQYLGGNAWTDLSGFTSSSTNHML